METKETWRPIPGYEGSYSVSNRGRIRSEARTIRYRDGRHRPTPATVMRQGTSKSGHLNVRLWRGNRQKTWWVHRLVLTAFHGAPPPGTECRHLDGNPQNNHIGNLQWATHRINMADQTKHGTHPGPKRTQCPRGHSLAAPNLVAWSQKRGHRQCLACARARSALQHNPAAGSLQEISDRKYAALTKGTPRA